MSDPTPPETGTSGRPAVELSYADAQAELDAILHELDGDEVDVDVLGARVRRAAELLRLCRDRIAAARFEVEQVVGELEAEAADAAVVDDLDVDVEVDDDDDRLDDGAGDDADDAGDELAGWAAGDDA